MRIKFPIPQWIQLLPVPVMRGPARGAWWTLYPYSGNWRRGGHEMDVEIASSFIQLGQGDVAWDFGAHFGIHTVGLAKIVGSTGQVVAFEPDLDSFKRLCLHLLRNHLNHVIPINKAASHAQGIVQLIQEHGPGSTTSHLPYPGEVPTDEKKHSTIETIAADDLVAEGKIRRPHFIKVDVEGHGGKAIQGSLASIKVQKPAILVSFHSPQEIEQIVSIIRPIGYSVYTPDGCVLSWEGCIVGKTVLFRCNT